MKKVLLFVALVFSVALSAQSVTTTPAVITDDYTGEIKIYYDPAGGSMATATACYAHIGATEGGVQWKCAPTWRSGEAKHQLAKEGDKWVLTIPNLSTYFTGCTGPYSELSMVFNDGPAGTKEGKTATGGDFFIAISPAGQLDVKFSADSSEGAVDAGSSVTVTANATSSADLVIKKNGTIVKQQSGTSISYSETLSTPGDYTYVVEATSGGQTASDSRVVAIISGSQNQARPQGLLEGITYNQSDATKATLCLYAKDRNGAVPDNVFVVGDFNNWATSNTYQMKNDSGYWWLEISGLEPGVEYAFQYALKWGSKVLKISDPYSEKVLHNHDQWEPAQQYPNLKPYPVQGDGYVSVLQTAKPQFGWSQETLNFQKPDRNNLVIYELWTYNFSPDKNFKAITARLNYLQNLGVNAIQIMPVTEFEGNISWGYNPTHYFAVDKSYGTEDDLKTLIDEAHKRGIAVILDMVFNHVTGAAPQAKMYWGTNSIAGNNPFFNQFAPHGASVNQDYDHNNPQVREMFKRVLKYWQTEYKADGYRMDISHGFCGQDCGNRSEIVFDYYNNGVKAGHEQGYFILEHWEGSYDERKNYTDWGMNVHVNNTHSYEQTAMGWLHDGDDLGQNSVDGFLTYCESHDEERNMFKAKTYGNGSHTKSLAGYAGRTPLNTAFNVMLDGSHMMWMFQELAYDISIFSNAQGEAGERVDPKPIPEELGWYTDSDRMASYSKLGKIIQLRTRILPHVFAGDPTGGDLGSGKAARSIMWGQGDDRVFIVGNFNVVDGTDYVGAVNISLPEGSSWYDYLEGGSNVMNAGTQVSLQPGEVKVYTAGKKDTPVVPTSYTDNDWSLGLAEFLGQEEDGVECHLYPTLADQSVYIEADETIRYFTVVGFDGRTHIPAFENNRVDVSELASGLYLLNVQFNNGQSKTLKFIKR